MRSMTFHIDDQSTGNAVPAVIVTISENSYGTVSFTLNVVGDYTGDLRGFFFDLANEALINTLSITSASAGLTELQQANDTVSNLGNGSNMEALLGSEAGFDAGIEIGTAGIGSDDYQSFSFTLASSAGALTLEDFSNVDFGVRLTSVGDSDSGRTGSAKLLEHTTSAIDALAYENTATEDGPAISGEVLADDADAGMTRSVVAVNGSSANVGTDVVGRFGTLHLNADGTYTYTLDPTNEAVQALAQDEQSSEIVDTFTYTATGSSEAHSSSTDSATLTIRIKGTNDAPQITAAVDAGSVDELADHAPGETTAALLASGTVDFADVDLRDSHTVAVAPAAAGYIGELSASVTNPSSGDGEGQVSWTFSVSDGAADYLGANDVLTQLYTVSVDDGHGGVDARDVTITINGSNDAPEITAAIDTGAAVELADRSLGENTTVHTARGTIDFADVDLTDTHAVSFSSEASYLGSFEATLAQDSTDFGTGWISWTFEVADAALDSFAEGETIDQRFAVSVDDGHGGTATQHVMISLIGTNDAPVVTGASDLAFVQELADGEPAENAATLPASGTVDFADVDLSDSHNVSVVSAAGYVGEFAAAISDPATGDGAGQVSWAFAVSDGAIDYLGANDVLTQGYTVVIEDGRGDSALQGVEIRIEGANDAPVVTDAVEAGSVTELAEDAAGESIALLSAIGTVSFSDVDLSDVHSISATPGAADYLGTLTPVVTNPSAGDGAGEVSWTFEVSDAAIEFLGEDDRRTQSYVVTIDDEHGGTATREVTITIEGTNDDPTANNDVFSAGGAGAQLIAEVETNNTQSGAQQISQGQFALGANPNVGNSATVPWMSIAGNIGPDNGGANDVDLYRLDLNAGQTLTLDIDDAMPDLDPVLHIFDASGAFVTANNDGHAGDAGSAHGWDSFLTYFVPISGTYYISVTSFANFASGTDSFSNGGGDVGNYTVNLSLLGARSGGGEDQVLSAGSVLANDRDIDATDDLSVSAYQSVSAMGAAVVMTESGNFTYDPRFAPDIQALARNESGTDTFTYTVADDHGGTDVGTVSIVVQGANDAPDITGGATTGLVYEDGGARAASGLLNVSDVDHGAIISWSTPGAFLPGTPVMTTYGFASVDTTGRWTYTLDNTRFVTQQLAQGQMASDTFTVRATDEHGAFDSQLVTVTVGGTEDRPNLPQQTLALSVFEDGAAASATTSASDIDNGSFLHWSLNRGSALGYFSDYEFRAESFTVQKNGATLFHDEFNNDVPPPQAPDFLLPPPPGATGPQTNYITSGLFEEEGGKLIFRGSNAIAFRGTGNNALIVGNEANLATNIDPANTQGGLKRNHQFQVEALFDLVQPTTVRQQYGIQLTDGFNQLADDSISFVVRRELSGLSVRLSNNDAVLDSSSLVASQALVPGVADQIRLRFSHEANAGHVTASYELIDTDPAVDVIVGSGVLGQVGIFGTDTPFPGDDNNWIRAGLFANAFDSNESLETSPPTFVQALAGTYGTLTVGNPVFNNVGQLNYTPDNASPAVQALAQGESAIDSFFVRAVDQFGMSTAQRVEVTVNGANDAPDITGGATTGLVYEDGGRVAKGQLSAVDIDNGPDLLGWEIASQGTRGAASVDSTGQWTYILRNEDQVLVQSLAHDQMVTDTFTVRAKDEHLAFDAQSEQTVTVEIRGTNDRPAIFVPQPPPGQPPLPAPSVTEDGSQAVTRQAFTFDIDAGDTRTLSVSHGTPLGYRSNFLFKADEFKITSSGTTLLEDTFGDGAIPNVGANPLYLTTGGLTESGGKLIFDGSKAGSFRGAGFNGLVAGMDATWNVGSASSTAGLQRGNDFSVEAVFDLVLPAEGRQGYGLSLSDSFGGPLNVLASQTGDDSVDLGVRRNLEDGNVYVQLTTSSAVADSSALVERMLLPLGTSADQIRLRLNHAAGSDVVQGSFELLDDGVAIAPATVFGTHALLFGADTLDFVADDEEYTRASLSISGLDTNPGTTTLAGTYGTLSVPSGPIGTPILTSLPFDWNYTLNNGAANVQALAAGQSATDAFHVRVTDARGVSAALPVNITVHGVNDAPVFAPTPPALTNLVSGFEGGLTGWQTSGSVTVVPGGTQGTSAARLTSTPTTISALENFLGVAPGTVGNLQPGSETTGAAIRRDISLNANETLRFDWQFDSGDVLPFDDFSFFTVAPVTATELASVTHVGNSGISTWQTGQYTAPVSGLYRVGFGVVNVGDTVLNSFLHVDNVRVTGASPAVGNVAEEGNTTASATLGFADVDLTDTHTVSAVPLGAGYDGTLTVALNADSTGSGSGAVSWNFSVANAAIQELRGNEIRTQTYTVALDDGHGGIATKEVNVLLAGVNDAPTGIVLTANQPPSGSTLPGAGAVIAQLSTLDVDAGDAFAYSFLSGGGGFAISGSSLITSGGLTENATHNFTLRSIDSGGYVTDQLVTIRTGTNAANPTLSTGSGDDILFGLSNPGASVDVLMAGSGDDTLFGQDGGDVLDGGTGNDFLYGGDGTDNYSFNLTAGNDVIEDSAGAADAIGISIGATALSSLNFERFGGDLQITYHGQHISVLNQFSGQAVESVSFTGTGSFAGYALGSLARNLNSDGANPVDGTPGRDVLASSSDGESLNGGDGDDMLFGNGGDDTLAGGTGANLLVGGVGADRFQVANDGSTDVIADFNAAAGDALDIRDLLSGFGEGSSPNAFVQLATASGSGVAGTTVRINADGVGTDFVAVAHLHGVTGLLLDNLIANSNLLLA